MIHKLPFARSLIRATVLLPLLGAASVQAIELYAPIGVPGAGLGLAFPLNDWVGVRADFMTLGNRTKDTTEDGIDYTARYKVNRSALLMDVFPFAGSFRITLGATSNKFEVDLDASGAGGSITIGDRTYATTAADGLYVAITFPKTKPYVGIGWGHQTGSGFRFSADIGATIGKATVSAVARGALATQPDIQANIDKELAELRDGVGKIKAIPQISVGIGYSF